MILFQQKIYDTNNLLMKFLKK